MGEIRCIVAAVDFSDASSGAVDAAIQLSRRLGATLVLLHVNDALAVVPNTDLANRLRTEDEADLDALVARARDAGVQARRAVLPGTAREDLARLAEGEGADLIVVGTHGRSGLASVLLGSVAESAVRHAHVPVLTVPSRARRGR